MYDEGTMEDLLRLADEANERPERGGARSLGTDKDSVCRQRRAALRANCRSTVRDRHGQLGTNLQPSHEPGRRAQSRSVARLSLSGLVGDLLDLAVS